MCEQTDTIKFRRDTKKRGKYGIDWYKYFDGVPPEDDTNDYEWNGSSWNRIWYDEDERET